MGSALDPHIMLSIETDAMAARQTILGGRKDGPIPVMSFPVIYEHGVYVLPHSNH